MEGGNGGLFTIGELSRANGATPRAIRFYEGMGLVSSCKRSGGGYRLFEHRELDRLNLVTGLRRSGFPIKDIVKLFSIVGRSSTAAEAAGSINGMLVEGAAEVREMAELLRLLAADLLRTAEILTRCLDCDRSFNELDCGDCQPFSDLNELGYPTAMKALWPLNNG